MSVFPKLTYKFDATPFKITSIFNQLDKLIINVY